MFRGGATAAGVLGEEMGAMRGPGGWYRNIFHCTHIYFKRATFQVQGPGGGNVVHLASL